MGGVEVEDEEAWGGRSVEGHWSARGGVKGQTRGVGYAPILPCNVFRGISQSVFLLTIFAPSPRLLTTAGRVIGLLASFERLLRSRAEVFLRAGVRGCCLFVEGVAGVEVESDFGLSVVESATMGFESPFKALERGRCLPFELEPLVC